MTMLVMTLGASSFGCQYDAATDACYAIAETYGARLAECGYYVTAEDGTQAVLNGLAAEGLSCDVSPIGIRDEEELYERCIPDLMTIDCATPDAVPAHCDDQIIYRGS